MLPLHEQELIRGFFKEMSFEDLADIAKSITKRNLTPTSLEDAICIICQHSDCIESILEKRKVTKRYLCEYLHKSKVSIHNSWDKPALIRKTLNFWKVEALSSSFQKSHVVEDTLPEESQSSLKLQPEPVRCEDEYFTNLCYEFSKWYYTLINDDDLSKLGPEHFFAESQMQVAVLNGDSTDTVEAQNSNHVAQTLRELKLRYNLKFLPNLAPGAVRFEHDIHGQVMLFVGGTLHSNGSNDDVVGVFEQMFLLIRDYSDNENWKIKKSQVILRSANHAIKSSGSANDENALSICS